MAARIIESGQTFQLTPVVIAEVAYTLRSFYRIARSDIVDRLLAFVQRENIATFGLSKDLVQEALLLCRPSGRVSFADALTWAIARSSGNTVIYSFDARFPDFGVEVRRDV
ncbi:MAG: PIN domain-containing protein [Chloroflexi bacterium]|nr:PIN domain-containing protein [Chloroflexota bacterium]